MGFEILAGRYIGSRPRRTGVIAVPRKTNPLVVLFDDPEQDKFVFWPIKNLSEAENISKQIRLENELRTPA